MRHAFSFMMFALSGLVSTVLATGGGVDLASLADWDIVVASDAIPSERYAAEELQRILAQATGQHLEIVLGDVTGDHHVFVGPSAPMRVSPVGFSVDTMGPEDLRIVVRDKFMAIAGGRPRGTLYGVYTFLEDHVGVRFLTADHTHVPKLPSKAVIGPLDRSYHPPLLFRCSYYGETNRNPALAARLRVNTVDGDPKFGGKTGISLINHSLGRQIPSSEYGKEHPEYYALRDGKRLSTSANDWYETEPCLTNPQVRKIVTEAVLAELKAHPEKENISVSQNDNDKYCQCADCQAIDEREGTPMGTLLTFVNSIADTVAKKHPKVMVGTLSYWYTRKPPKTIKPRPNVQIQLCSIECCVVHPINDPKCAKNVQFCKDMADWGQITSNIYIWNYNVNFNGYLLPFPNLRAIEPNIRYFVEKGAKGIFMQAAGNSTGAEFSDLRNYVMSNLLWDPNRSGARLIDEFLDLHYGPAAPPIRRFIRNYHDHAENQGVHPNCIGRARDYAIDESIAKAGLEAFREAMGLADSDTLRARVEKASICAYRAAIEPAWELSENPVARLESALAEPMRPLVKQLLDLCARYQVPMFSEGITTDAARQRLQRAFGLKDGEEF